MDTDPPILFDLSNGIARVCLNRPEALNALTQPMCAAMLDHLRAWAHDDAVRAVVVSGNGRAFSAGGDVRALSEDARRHPGGGLDFLRVEYANNAAIHHFPKPYVALIDGYTMGGGVGVSVHGSHRVATENTLWAMPETRIGFYPDVGGSYFLPRLPGAIGMYAELTGLHMRAADIRYAGIATHVVSSARCGEIVPRLEAGEDLDLLLADIGMDVEEAPLKRARVAIDRVFSANSVEEIMERLKDEGPWGADTRAELAARSPTSLKLTFHALRAGRDLGFDDCLRMEYRMAVRALRGHDFHEGVRAMLIDKDRNPIWKPSDLSSVSDEVIAAHFAPLGDGEPELRVRASK